MRSLGAFCPSERVRLCHSPAASACFRRCHAASVIHRRRSCCKSQLDL